MLIHLEPDDKSFPDPLLIPRGLPNHEDVFGYGGSLHPDLLLDGYPKGIFPWTPFRNLEREENDELSFNNQIQWYCPDRRCVLFPDNVHVSHSLRTQMNKGIYSVTFDHCFDVVISNCAGVHDRYMHPGAWLGDDMINVFCELHRRGAAHSVEVWENDRLAGGLYGLYLKGVFFGESMFSLIPSGSKLAMVGLCNKLLEIGGKFIDCQIMTRHLKSMGASPLTYANYRTLIDT